MDCIFHINLNSTASSKRFPGNTAGDFTSHLSERIVLRQGLWFCSLTHCQLPAKPSSLVSICCDACVESAVGEKKLPIIAVTALKTTRPSRVTWVPVKVSELSDVRLYIKTASGSEQSFPSGTSYCTLEFRHQDEVVPTCAKR